jgi:hypothetical protein
MSSQRTLAALVLLGLCFVLLIFSFQTEQKDQMPIKQSKVSIDESIDKSKIDHQQGIRAISQVTQVSPVTKDKSNDTLRGKTFPRPQAFSNGGSLAPLKKRLFPAKLDSQTPWRRWSQMRAIAVRDWKNQAPVVAQVSGYYLVPDAQFNDRETSMSSPFVVFDERTSRVGVVTGVLRVTAPEESVLPALLAKYRLFVEDAAPQIHQYFLRSGELGLNLKGLREKISKEPGIEDVALEILERQYEKK